MLEVLEDVRATAESLDELSAEPNTSALAMLAGDPLLALTGCGQASGGASVEVVAVAKQFEVVLPELAFEELLWHRIRTGRWRTMDRRWTGGDRHGCVGEPPSLPTVRKTLRLHLEKMATTASKCAAASKCAWLHPECHM